MIPRVGETVHYTSYGTPGGEYPQLCRAAIITQVGPDNGTSSPNLGVAVLNPTGIFFNADVRFGGNADGGTWHRPYHDGSCERRGETA